MMQKLNRKTLSLPDGVAAPAYNVEKVTPGIVHIGLGGFYRAHFARYTHDLMEADPANLGWGIIGAGLRSNDTALLQALKRQDGLYTLIERDGMREERVLIGSILGPIDASADRGALLDAIARPQVRIVSVTVSEHGYHLDGVSRSLNLADPGIRHDIDAPRAPKTMLGVIVESFRRRRDANMPAFTALSCDNIQHNGKVLRAATLALARQSDASLAAWIEAHGRFPSSMVDRITPVPTPAQIAEFRDQTGLADEAPIFAESFRQWVIEDQFVDGQRPPWDRVGAQFVDDVAPYEAMKLRLLNASHLAIASLGALSGYESVIQTINDPLIRRYMERLMDSETGPTLPRLPGIDLAAYKAQLIERFANPAIRDTVQRINTDAPINLLLDPLRDRLAAHAPIDLLALALAAWCLRVHNDAAKPIEGRAMGRAEARLQDQVRTGCGDPASFLSVEPIFGQLGSNGLLIRAVRSWLQSFQTLGVAQTLRFAEAFCF